MLLTFWGGKISGGKRLLEQYHNQYTTPSLTTQIQTLAVPKSKSCSSTAPLAKEQGRVAEQYHASCFNSLQGKMGSINIWGKMPQSFQAAFKLSPTNRLKCNATNSVQILESSRINQLRTCGYLSRSLSGLYWGTGNRGENEMTFHSASVISFAVFLRYH